MKRILLSVALLTSEILADSVLLTSSDYLSVKHVYYCLCPLCIERHERKTFCKLSIKQYIAFMAVKFDLSERETN